jgi:hypothetical protein
MRRGTRRRYLENVLPGDEQTVVGAEPNPPEKS